MKVGTYLAILIFACLIGGYLIEIVLSGQFTNYNVASGQFSENRLWLRDLDRVISDSNQYLISTDLILGSGETYLTSGARAKGELIADNLLELQRRNHLLVNGGALEKLSGLVAEISRYLEQGAAAAGQTRDRQLSLLLAQYDPVAYRLSSELEELKQSAASALDREARALEARRRAAERVKILTRTVFSMFLLALWYWANRKISMPLRALRNMAQSAEVGLTFEGVERGPKEIQQLSNNMREMTNSLSYQATHDPLTKLLNRRAFDRNLLNFVQTARARGVTHALCFIDLDRFKMINDTCGHASGDELLQRVAQLIESNVRSSDVVSRLGGDEFAVLLTGCNIATAVEISDKIRVAIRDLKYFYDDQVFSISASIGVTLIAQAGDSVVDLLNAADTACKFVKDSGRDNVHVFDVGDELLQKKRSESSAIAQLISAVDDNRFVLFRQNIVPLNALANRGDHYELLVRMRSPDGVLVSPDKFLPLAERYDLCKRVDQCVVETAINWFVANPDELEQLEMCAINLSGQSIGSTSFREFIIEKLQSTGFPGEKLCFEITETAAVTHMGTAIDIITRLQDIGCKFALDDFGSGLSSFGYLKELPVDFIKIDGSFVRDMVDDHISMATVKSISDIAKALGKKTVAEFVESGAIADALKGIGVDYAQGYHFGRPKLFIDPADSAAENCSVQYAYSDAS